MKPLFKALWVCAIVVFLPVSIEARTWTDSTGQYKIEAELVQQKDGWVQVRKPDGTLVPIKIDKLCQADQDYLASKTDMSEQESPDPIPPKPLTPEQRIEKQKRSKILQGLGKDEDGYFLVALMAKERVEVAGGGPARGFAGQAQPPAGGGAAAPAARTTVVTFGFWLYKGRKAAENGVYKFVTQSPLRRSIDDKNLPKSEQRISYFSLLKRFEESEKGRIEANNYRQYFKAGVKRHVMPAMTPDHLVVGISVSHEPDGWSTMIHYARPSHGGMPPLRGEVVKLQIPAVFTNGYTKRYWLDELR